MSWRQALMRARRRETLYKMAFKRSGGFVACYCCGKHVNYEDATLEHILPISKGGTDNMQNLAISHEKCNHARGNNTTSVKG